MLTLHGDVSPISISLELSKQTPLFINLSNLTGVVGPILLVVNPSWQLVSTPHRYSESPPSLGQLETTRRRLENIPSRLQCAPVVQSVENILTNCFSIRVQAATQQSAALTLPADTQVVTRQSRGGQCSATSEQSTNSQWGTGEQRAVRKLTLDSWVRFRIIELN